MNQVSVIIPNYNYSRYLQRRIDSIVNQTIKPSEIIFLDDCSTDDSLVVAKKILSNQNIPYRIVSNENNQGVFRQWLKGIELTQYDCFWIAEADDYCELNLLEKLLSAFDDNNVVMSYCDSNIINEDNVVIYDDLKWKNTFFETNIWSSNFIELGNKIVADYYSVINVSPNASAIIFRKNKIIFNNYSIINSYQKIGDWLFYIIHLSQSENAKLAYYSERCNYHLRHSDNVTTKSRNNKSPIMYNESLSIYKYCLEKFTLSEFVQIKIYFFILEWLRWYQIDGDTNKLLLDIIKIDGASLFFKTFKENLNNLIEDNDDLRNNYLSIISSKSWKITKPLRLFTSFCRSLIKS